MRNPTLDMLLRIATALEIDLWRLLKQGTTTPRRGKASQKAEEGAVVDAMTASRASAISLSGDRD